MSAATGSQGTLLYRHIGKPCPYCGCKMIERSRLPTRDHKHPRYLGGTLAGDNLVICCRRCNGDKRNLTLKQWAAVLKGLTDPRADRVARIAGVTPPAKGPSDRCSMCDDYMAKFPGRSEICIEKWRGLAWNEHATIATICAAMRYPHFQLGT